MEALLKHLDAVYRYAVRLTRDATRAEDLTQETMLRALGSVGRLRDRAAMRGWLLRIATNLHYDERRKTMPLLGDYEPTIADSPVEERCAQRDDLTVALAALDQLPERQQQAIHLVTIEGLSHAEAADIMGVSVTAAKASLSAARKTLRRRLTQIDAELCGCSPRQRKE